MWPAVDKALFTSGRSLRLTMPPRLPDPLPADLAGHVRRLYRAHYARELALGTVRPLVMPWGVLVTFALPVVYFSVPHRRRPWLFGARYLLMLCIVAYNVRETFVATSPNFAMGYAVGLMQAWGIIWNLTLLVFMRPQFDAERVERRLARRPVQGGDAPDEDIARSLALGYEYYWQPYPEDGPFLARLGWSFDLVTSFRGTGWNWCVPVVPHFSRPEKPQSGELVDLASIPESTPQGYRRHTTRRGWLLSELRPFVAGYLALDALSVVMMKDPYFILGPEYTASAVPVPLPPVLAALPSWLLFLYRSALSFAGVLTAISFIMKSWQLTCALALAPLLGSRADLWHYPTVFGGFTHNVLDRGLAGFWGGWWHQTFRVAFGAPAAWLAGRRPEGAPPGRAAAGLFAFAQSGFLHALGSASCIPPGKPWAPPVFFMLSWAGILLQSALRALPPLPGVRRALPRCVTRAGNLVFVIAWLAATQYWMLDDIARSGIWMFEPVPVSLFRALGLGGPGDGWWRWGWDELPRLHSGGHWWDSGIAL